MWVFFSVLVALGLFLFGPFQAELKNKKGREGFFFLTLSFCGIQIYRGVFFLHFKHVVRPQIIKVKKAGFKKIYVATIERKAKKYDFSFLLRSTDFRKLDATLWLGTGDAAHTALLCGALNTAARSVLRAFGLEHACVVIRPDFDRMRICAWVQGIVRLSLADIIGRFLKEMRQKFYASHRKRIKHYHV